jgi:hypothetical protein
MLMAQPPALIGGIMLGTAAWLEVWAILFISPLHIGLALIPGLFFVAGLVLPGVGQERSHPVELAIGGICIAVAIGFVLWFCFVPPIETFGALISLVAGILVLFGVVFIAGRGKGY